MSISPPRLPWPQKASPPAASKPRLEKLFPCQKEVEYEEEQWLAVVVAVVSAGEISQELFKELLPEFLRPRDGVEARGDGLRGGQVRLHRPGQPGKAQFRSSWVKSGRSYS